MDKNMEEQKENKKWVTVSLETVKTVKPVKEKQKRQVTNEKKWSFREQDLSSQNQWELVEQIKEKRIINENKEYCDIILQQLNGKIYGYKSQDIDKKILDETKIVNLNDVIDLLIFYHNKCYYCQESVQVLYEFVREPSQWTLDRLDNQYGHNTDNVVISCLRCNLRRKTMHSERYVFTKQMVIKKV
jgi:hypothetical protein